MKLTLNIFRIVLLLTLIFRLFFVKYFNYEVNVISYILLAIGLLGMVVCKIILYIKKKRRSL